MPVMIKKIATMVLVAATGPVVILTMNKYKPNSHPIKENANPEK